MEPGWPFPRIADAAATKAIATRGTDGKGCATHGRPAPASRKRSAHILRPMIDVAAPFRDAGATCRPFAGMQCLRYQKEEETDAAPYFAAPCFAASALTAGAHLETIT